MFASLPQELGRRAAGPRDVASKEVWGALQACKRGGVCLKRSGVREVCWGRGDVEVFASRGLELGRRAAGAGTWRCLLQEIWSS